MKTSDFDFYLPEELIAQEPIENREFSNLLIYNKSTNVVEHKKFYDIIDYLTPNDCLVLNDTKVLPSRLYGIKEETNAHIEILLLKQLEKNKWECLCKPARRVKVDDVINFNDILKAKCIKEEDEGIRVFEMQYEGIFYEILDKLGEMPLPPYIHKKLKDKDRYQTVYAKNLGSAAAPTAGLHFNKELLEKIKNKGIEIIYLTLHVGLGTFRPVTEEDIEKHPMHKETYYISEDASIKLKEAIKNKKNIVACGTTSVRTLESAYKDDFKPGSYETNIFIYPGYEYKVVDKLITNFHLPKSTLIMLVSAFITREKTLELYQEAINKKYHFFSFGDAMFITKN